MAKMSGRGLGHTGGTIDKLESIPGYQVELSREEFIKQVNDIGISVISQSGNLVPADKKLYALRDVTGTVDSIPLIASSIMSKKIASGADTIFIDVKVGRGALMKDLDSAKELARTMINIGKHFNKTVICILTNMSEPLGCAVGNALEVKETIETLQGYGPKDVMELIIEITAIILNKVKGMDKEEARALALKQLNNGEAYNKFKEFVKAQHGRLEELKISDHIFSVKSTKSGYITAIDALELGEIAREIGAGRLTKEDKIDYSVGLVLTKKVGDYVNVNDELLKVYLSNKDVRLDKILGCYKIETEAAEEIPLIYDILM
jgi:pyrimidine-nucleoside phosphorylase